MSMEERIVYLRAICKFAREPGDSDDQAWHAVRALVRTLDSLLTAAAMITPELNT